MTSKKIFDEIDVTTTNQKKRCRILRKLAKDMKTTRLLSLDKHHKEKHVNWEKKYMKTDFSAVIFSDECRATLNGHNGWVSDWVLHGNSQSIWLRKQ